MKKSWRAAAACALAGVMVAAGCGGDGNTGSGLAPEGELMTYTEYNLDTYVRPYWHTREIYNETVMFVGADDSAPLLYDAKEILSVRNYGLDIEYEEGADYTYENGVLKRTADSSIPYFEIDDYYRTSPDSVGIAVDKSKISLELEGDRYLKYGEGDTFTKKQIAVTYRHSSPWEGPIPAGKSEKLAKSLAKLKSGEETTVLFYGDSITTGCNSSGTSQGGNVSPHAESFPRMICSYFEEKYAANIDYYNTAVGGWTTEQGQDALEGNVIGYAPDLVIIGFGMNDMLTTPGAYSLMIQDMLERIHSALPDAEIVLVGSMVPNYESTWYGNQELFAAELLALEEEYDFVAAANVTEMHKALFSAGKRYCDVTGNNINHPNDFVARLYAQVILKTMLGGEYCDEITN